MRLPDWARPRKPLLLVLAVLLLIVGWPRILAEYYYLRIVMDTSAESYVNYFDRLEYMGRPAAIPPLLRLLGHRDSLTRATAARRLEKYRGEDVVDALLELARNDPDTSVREAAISSLGVIGDPRAAPVLTELARHDRRVSAWALDALRKLGPAGKPGILEYHRTHADPAVRARAWFCESAFEKQVQEALAGPHTDARLAAASCVGHLSGKEAAIAAFKEMLSDPDPLMRVGASEQLGKLGDKSGLGVARAVVVDQSLPREVRVEAALAIGKIGDQAAFPLLRDVMHNDPSRSVREAAHIALQMLFSGGDPRAHGREPEKR